MYSSGEFCFLPHATSALRFTLSKPTNSPLQPESAISFSVAGSCKPCIDACPNHLIFSGFSSRNSSRECSPNPTMLSSENMTKRRPIAAISPATCFGSRSRVFRPKNGVTEQNSHENGHPRDAWTG